MNEEESILIVDDDELVCKGMKAVLRGRDYKVDIAETGQKAIEKTKKRFYNLVFLDIFLKDMEGIELIKPLKELHPEIAIVMITGHASLENAIKALNDGADGYIIKPVDAKEVRERVKNIIKKQSLVLENKKLLDQVRAELKKRIKAEEALQDSSQQWQDTFDSICDAVSLIDKKGKIVRVNEAMIEFCGKPPEEIVGRFCWEVVHGADKPVKGYPFMLMLKTRQRESLVIKRGDQWFDVSVDPVMKNGNIYSAVHIISDITERKKVEEALSDREKRFRSVVQTAVDAIITIDSRGKITFWDDGAQAMFGYLADEVNGKPLTLIIPQRFCRAHQEGLKRAVLGGKSEIIGKALERTGRRKDGSEFPLDLSLSKWEIKEGVFFTGILRDISDRKERDEEIQASEYRFRELFNHMKSGAVVYEISKNKKDFIIKDFNESAERIEKVKRENIIDKGVVKMFPGVVELGLFDVFKRVLRTGKSEFHRDSFYKDKRISGWRENFVYRLSPKEIVAIYDDVTDRRRAEDEIKRKSRQLEFLFELSKKITSIISMDELLPWIVEEAAGLLGADACNYRMKEDNYLVRGSGIKEGSELMLKERLKIGESLSGIVAKEKKPLLIADEYPKDKRLIPEHRKVALKYGFQSFISVPMKVGNQVLGVLNVYSKTPKKFIKQDIGLLSSFADMAAIAVRNSTLFEEKTAKVAHFTALYEMNKMIAFELQKEDLLPLVAEQANLLLHTDGCNFRLREGDEFVASCGMEQTSGLIIKERIKIGESLSGLIAKEKKPLVVENIQVDKRYLKEHKEAAKRIGIRSFLGVPMMVRDEVIGVLHVYSKKIREFSKSDVDLLSAFADQASIAVKNAEYLEKIERVQETALRSEKLASIGKLVAGVTHEILNPVNIISMKIQLMMIKGVEDKKVLHELAVMKEQVDRIVKISEALLKFSRQRKVQDVLDVSVKDIFRDTLLLVERELLTKNIEIQKEFAKGLPNIEADPNQLRQVFLNLITNARDVMPKGGKIHISVRLTDRKKGILISIKDTGSGIPAEHLATVFDPFFTTKGEGEGTGLGLSVCYGIIENHGGKIWAENNKNRGTCFFIELPIKKETK